jgi:hypothetical protein
VEWSRWGRVERRDEVQRRDGVTEGEQSKNQRRIKRQNVVTVDGIASAFR